MQKEQTLHPFLSAERIETVVTDLAQRVSEDYRQILAPKAELLVIVTLKGATYFAADLVRRMSVPVRVDYVRAQSYGTARHSSGNVRLLRDIDSEVEGQQVLLLDEIVDSGHTLYFLIQHLKKRSPLGVKICTLLNKASRREVQIPVDYIGLEVEDKFLVGYGLDLDERYRNLKDICYIPN